MDSSRSQPPASERSPLLPYPPQGSPQPGAHATRSRRPGAVTSPARARLIVRGLVVLLVILVSAVGLAIALQEIANRSGRPKREGRINPAVLAEGRNGAVATENVVCSKIGVDVLKDDGTAVDAAVAAALCIGTLNMFSSGIGGGGFMVVRDPSPAPGSAAHVAIDFRETAPSGANETMYRGRPWASRFGGLSVGVPGELRGLEEAHKRWGTLPWERLVRPSVRLAEGTRVSKELARRLRFFGSFMLHDKHWAPIFTNHDTGALLREGDWIKRHAYARTLERVAREGAGVFYEGDIAKSIVNTVQEHGGLLTEKDMRAYRANFAPALRGSWFGRPIWTTHAPTSGPALLSLLNVLQRFDGWRAEGPTALNVHRFLEALKFSFAQRTEIGDPAFLSSEANARILEIPTAEEADKVRSNITDDRTHPLEYYHPKFDILDDHGTMHLSVVDKHGMAVALTSTVNLIFGSQVMDPHTGVILNDEMDDSSTPGVPNAFGLAPSPYNYPLPGKRPLSSISPAIIEHEDGSFALAIGGSGGSRIFGSVAQTLVNLEWGADLSEAIEAPRIHHQLLPVQVSVETTYDEHILDALRQKGHEVDYLDINLGIAEVQAVMRDGPGKHAKVFAASDSRKNGIAAAY